MTENPELTIDQEYAERREQLYTGNDRTSKWTINLNARLKAGLKILATEKGMQYAALIERIVIEALTPEEWDGMMARLEVAEASASTPKAK